MTKHLKYLLISLILITSACTAVQAQNDEGDLVSTQWKLASIGERGAEKPVIEGSQITIEFKEEGQVDGSGGCNSYGGTYTVQDGKIQFGEIVSTLMACANQAVMEQEQQYLQALNTAGRFAITDDTLTIWYDGDKGALNYERATALTLVSSPKPPTPTPLSLPAATTETPEERVEFKPGANSATRSGDLPGGGAKEYVVSATASQSMHVQTIGYGAPVNFTIRSPQGETWSGEQQASEVYVFTAQVVLPQDGDYVVTLSVPPEVGATRYDVIFTIGTGQLPAALLPAESPERVNFASGDSSVQLSGLLPSGPAVKQYVLAANAGQSMTVEITSDDVSISLTITSPSGEQQIPETSPSDGGYRVSHTLRLDETGDYLVTLTKVDHTPSTNYIVDITIQ